jgi:aspartate carbamoyltransferase catalytic subunit
VVTKARAILEDQLEDAPLDLRGFDRPRALIDAIEENLTPLLDLVKRPVISARQFTGEQILQLARLSARFETQPQLTTRPLTGKILISAFYEPSTRTRLSFESAWHRLGGDIMSITDSASTGIAKGESLRDIGEMLNNYGDLVVLRDSNANSVYDMAESLRIPIISGGNGYDEHPTQALADIYALLKWRPSICNGGMTDAPIRFGFIGVPGKMRTVRSLLLLLRNFTHALDEIVVISDEKEPFAEGQLEELTESGLRIRVSDKFEEELPKLDVVYQNAILWTGSDYEELGVKFRLHASSPLRPHAVILHPLARGPELSCDLDNTVHNWYFAQARGAVFIRMALLATILKVFV